MARARWVGRQAVVDGEHGTLVFEDDAQGVAVEVAGRGGGDLLHLGDVALGLRLGDDAAARRHELQAVGAHIGGALQRDHAAPVLEGTAGHEGHQTQPLRQCGEHLTEGLRHSRGPGARDDRRKSTVDVAEQGPRVRRRGAGGEACRELGLAFCDQPSVRHGTPSRPLRTAYPKAGRRPTKVVVGVKFSTGVPIRGWRDDHPGKQV